MKRPEILENHIDSDLQMLPGIHGRSRRPGFHRPGLHGGGGRWPTPADQAPVPPFAAEYTNLEALTADQKMYEEERMKTQGNQTDKPEA